MEGSKIISRKKGFTTTTCVSGVAIGQQTKQFEALPESAKVNLPDMSAIGQTIVDALSKWYMFAVLQSDAADNQLCSKTTGPDLKDTCTASCNQACTAALSEYADRDSRLTGYSIDAKTKDRLAKSSTKQCAYESAKHRDKYGLAIR